MVDPVVFSQRKVSLSPRTVTHTQAVHRSTIDVMLCISRKKTIDDPTRKIGVLYSMYYQMLEFLDLV